jgi:hypothetical protein
VRFGLVRAERCKEVPRAMNAERDEEGKLQNDGSWSAISSTVSEG